MDTLCRVRVTSRFVKKEPVDEQVLEQASEETMTPHELWREWLFGLKQSSRQGSRRGRIWELAKRIVFFSFILSIFAVFLLRFVMPPLTFTQLVEALGYGLERDYVSWDEISNEVKLAAIASEDQEFLRHGGFDWMAMQKSLKKRKGRNRNRPFGRATSTITQQTARNVFLWRGGTITRYIRKIPEAYFTLLIEWGWGKKRILEVYLNVIEMGPGVFGIEAAAQKYFGKQAKNLTRDEAAMIIACLPNPKKFTVKPVSGRVAWRFPEIVREMQNIEDDPAIKAFLGR
jgi:monofunctional glycosyltransferase